MIYNNNIRIIVFYFFAFIIIQLSEIKTQSLPKNHFLYTGEEMLYDAGMNWESLSLFEPIKIDILLKDQTSNQGLDKDYIGQFDLSFGDGIFHLQGLGFLKYDKGFYGYFIPTVKSQPMLNHKPSSFFTMTNNQNLSGIGFQNDWAILQIGKGTESWGAGNNIQLALSDYSDAYDYVLLGSDYGKLRVRYIHGFLENVNENINRYLTARGFEWTNKKSLIIGFSETVIYSGKNRSFDIGYLNPISSHLEIELNDRLNTIGNANSNAVWQIHMDLLLINKLRLSFNYLIDEFIIDKKIESWKENGTGLSVKVAYTPFFSNQLTLSIYGSFVRIGTPTFRHLIGTNNFVQKGKPIGWYQGSDGEEYLLGVSFYKMQNVQLIIKAGHRKSGNENIIKRPLEPYKDYMKGIFPSGNVKRNYFTEALINVWLKNKMVISNSFRLQKTNHLFCTSISILF